MYNIWLIIKLIFKKSKILIIICSLYTNVRIKKIKNFNCKSFDLLFVIVQKNANNIFSNSMFVLHVIMMHISILSKFDHILCRFEFWMFYMRFFFNIEIFWNDQNFFICFVTKISKFVYFLIWKIIVVVIFASKIVNLKNHCDRDFRIEYFSQFKINLR